MGKLVKSVVAVGLMAGSLALTVGLGGPVSSAPSDATGFTVLRGDTGCELQQIDVATGQLTDLPAPPAPEACVADLAATVDGQVYGLVRGFATSPDDDQLLSLVSFSTGGAATLTELPIVDPGNGGSGVAVAADGTWYLMGGGLYSGDGPDARCPISPLHYCLYTLDPATASVTPIGGQALQEEATFAWLTDCTSGLFTTVIRNSTTPVFEIDPATGIGIGNSYPQPWPTWRGIDCIVGGDTLYALNGPVIDPGSDPDTWPPVGSGGPISIGTVTAGVGGYTTTKIADLSDPQADVLQLAVIPAAPAPSTTTTTAGAAAEQVVTVPAFTG